RWTVVVGCRGVWMGCSESVNKMLMVEVCRQRLIDGQDVDKKWMDEMDSPVDSVLKMTKQKVVVGDGKSVLAMEPNALFTTDVKKPSLMPGGYIKISKKKLLQNLEITSGARINAWIESMRASSPTFNRQDKTTWMTKAFCGQVKIKLHGCFVLSLANVDPYFMMEDESLLWTSNDVVILLQHGSEKIPLNYVSETEITCFSVPSAAIYSGYLAG
ncbi:hypothetical protein Tco_0697776, partial [Tanacetum coccineum]